MSDTGGFGLDECVTEIPYNGVDEDCDGADLTDVDGDGEDSTRVGGADCDDSNAEVHPDAEERCGDLVDDDCDDQTDEGCDVASAGPADPGGFHWVCGPSFDGTWLALALAVVLVRARR